MLSQRISIAQDFVNEFSITDEIPLVVDDLRSGEDERGAAHDNPVDAVYAVADALLRPPKWRGCVQGGADGTPHDRCP